MLLTDRARNLRRNQTPQESILWYNLRDRRFKKFKFRRQYPIGRYIVDFCCFEKKLIIEVDGGQHNLPNDLKYDAERDKYLASNGYRVCRFWNNEINYQLTAILDKIYFMLISEPSP
jgi:adenine-specific DNA-methyltransferase